VQGEVTWVMRMAGGDEGGQGMESWAGVGDLSKYNLENIVLART